MPERGPSVQRPIVAPATGTPSDRSLLSHALAGIVDAVHGHSGAVYLLAPGEPVLVMTVMAGLPRAFAAPWERVALGSPIPVADAVREHRTVWVSGEEEMSSRYPRVAVVLPYPFALAALPVAVHGVMYGAVFVSWPGSHPPELSNGERELLTSACERLALGLEHAARAGRPVVPGAAPPVPDPVPPVPAAVEAARMVARLPYGMCALDLDGRVTYANAAAANLLGVTVESILRRQLWAALPWLDDPVYEDRYRAALISQQPTSFVALRPPRRWLSFRLYPSTSGLSVRITRAKSRTVPGRSHAEPDEEAARLVHISHILSLASALTEAVGVQDVIQLVADEILPALGGHAVVILGSEHGRLHVLGQRGYEDPSVVDRFEGMPLTAPTPGAHALVTGVPAFFESRRELERLYPARRATPDGLGAWAYLPLVASGRPVGTCVLGYTEARAFPAEERAQLTSLSGLIAQALERARLYDTKHRLAHGLQDALLPRRLPLLTGIEAAARYLPGTRGMEIGGDFYDLIPAGTGAAVVIGDVQGHNVTAAGLMGQVRTAVRAYTAVGQSPTEVVRSANRLLVDLESDLFVSCLYLHLDTAADRLVLARAGHPPPLLRGPDGRVQVLGLDGGPLLGVDAGATYPRTEVPFPPGSLLVLYTDGLIESRDTDLDEALSEIADRLAAAHARPLEDLADHLVHHVERTQERTDDVALMLLRHVNGHRRIG
ncbi:PP2C family protein-serine/threonine phosphatase [Streptomyces sp. NPDC058001]|uniref:PP2C family protein-serine/threonine phosphatase n=1 Tax=Streptomyces sp. NPDC058001 TaxID=3346300 RepID=UPI0036E30E1B